METSLHEHLEKNERCKEIHSVETQTVYIKCSGPCKKNYYKFGKSIGKCIFSLLPGWHDNLLY